MTRRAPEESDSDQKAAVCLAIVAFMEAIQSSPLLHEVGRAVDEAKRKKNLKGLKTILNDLHEWVSGLPPVDVARLNAELQTKFGETLDGLAQTEKVLQGVFKAGRIKTDEEYEILERFVGRASQSGQPSPDVERANQLLASYKVS